MFGNALHECQSRWMLDVVSFDSQYTEDTITVGSQYLIHDGTHVPRLTLGCNTAVLSAM